MNEQPTLAELLQLAKANEEWPVKGKIAMAGDGLLADWYRVVKSMIPSCASDIVKSLVVEEMALHTVGKCSRDY